MSHRTRFAVLVFSVALLAVLPGCEDDPILEPTDGGKTGGGSYGKMLLPATPVEIADTTTNPAVF